MKRLYTVLLDSFITMLNEDALSGAVDNDLVAAQRLEIVTKISASHELLQLASRENKYGHP